MSFYEEMNPADISVDELLSDLRLFLPNIQAESIHFFYHGTYNVFEVNKKYILRVADREFRNKQGLSMLKRESKVLNFLRKKLPISIPKILHINESNKIPFSIHEKIPGKSLVFLSQEILLQQKKKIAAEISKFLSVFHSSELMDEYLTYFPEQKFSSIDFNKSHKARWKSRFEEAKDVAYQYLNQEQKVWLSNIFEEYLNDENNFDFSPRITHCDFDTSNILVDSRSFQVTGIIDFEECKIWDPAADLLFFDEGPEFMKAILDNYKYSKQESLLARMKFYYSRTCVPYLVWGTNHNRPSMIEEGIRRIKKNMITFPAK